MTFNIVLFIVAIIPVFLAVAVLYIWRWWHKKRRRRSPLTTDLVRVPGYSLRTRIDDLTSDILAFLAIMALPGLFLALWGYQRWEGKATSYWAGIQWLALLTLIAVGVFIFLIVRLVAKRQKILEGLDAELSVAQLLEILKPMGCFIFHDIQAGKFNIDHVVVSPGGVFAIETKSRLKPVTGGGMRDAEVTYDGVSLKFPGWSESKPLQQAKAQSKWLGSQLSRSTGDDVQVRAVLALPGWYVNPKARGDVIVLNPKNCGWMAKMAESNGLDETVMKRICFQLEKLCTDKKR